MWHTEPWALRRPHAVNLAFSLRSTEVFSIVVMNLYAFTVISWYIKEALVNFFSVYEHKLSDATDKAGEKDESILSHHPNWSLLSMFLLLQQSITLKPDQTRSVSIDLFYIMWKKRPDQEMHQVKFALKKKINFHFLSQQTEMRLHGQNIKTKVQ